MTAPTTEQLREMIAECAQRADLWIMPGDGNARMDGSIDAMVYELGEFSKPIHHFDPATIRAMAEEIIASRETISRLANYVNDVALVVGSEHLLDLPEGIARKVKAAVLAEREACAKLADDYLRNSGALRLYVSAAIRARQENGT